MSSKTSTCNIRGCSKEPERTLSKEKLTEALKKENLELDVRDKITKIKLCKEHYRKLKKHTKKTDKLERIRSWGPAK